MFSIDCYDRKSTLTLTKQSWGEHANKQAKNLALDLYFRRRRHTLIPFSVGNKITLVTRSLFVPCDTFTVIPFQSMQLFEAWVHAGHEPESTFAYMIPCWQYMGTILQVVRTKRPEQCRFDDVHLKEVLVDAGVDGLILLRIEVPDAEVELQPRVSAALMLARKCLR